MGSTDRQKHDATRAPRQQRARERVSQILDAAKALIAERGSAGLKIQDIAERAGVTASSIYQYFPNKAAIIQELGRQYIAQVRGMLIAEFSQPADLREFGEMSFRMSRRYYQLHREDPVIRDIWMGTAVDKSIEDLDALDTQENTDLLFERAKPFLPKAQWDEARRLIFLSIEMNTAMIRLALKLGGEEGDRIYAQAERLMSRAFVEELDRLGAA